MAHSGPQSGGHGERRAHTQSARRAQSVVHSPVVHSTLERVEHERSLMVHSALERAERTRRQSALAEHSGPRNGDSWRNLLTESTVWLVPLLPHYSCLRIIISILSYRYCSGGCIGLVHYCLCDARFPEGVGCYYTPTLMIKPLYVHVQYAAACGFLGTSFSHVSPCAFPWSTILPVSLI